MQARKRTPQTGSGDRKKTPEEIAGERIKAAPRRILI